MRKLFLSVILALGLFHTASADILDKVTGHWGINPETIGEDQDKKELLDFRGCEKSPVVITVDRKNMRYKAVHTGEDSFESNGDILGIEKLWISIRYDDETEKMKNGELNIWHLFFVSEDEFYWIKGPGVREGEREGIVGLSRIRCKTGNV